MSAVGHEDETLKSEACIDRGRRGERTIHPTAFEYFAPRSTEEAIRLLQRLGDEAKVLAGGQSLLPLMKLRLARPKAVVDLGRIPGLAYIREAGDGLRIGSMTRTGDLERSEIVRQRYAALADAASVIADPLVRNMGTVGGNLSHGDPANDLPACMLAFDASYEILGPEGSRAVPARGFYRDTFATALRPDEILTEVRVPKARDGQGSAYVKLERRAGDFPIVGVAATMIVDVGSVVRSAGLGLTAVAPTALDTTSACEPLLDHPFDATRAAEVARRARALSRPIANLQGTAEYKRAMVERLTVQALERAYERAAGGR